MGLPLVSIIVPTFERPESLRLVLASIELQRGLSHRDLEVIVTDDGSRDHTPDVVTRFRDKSRFNVIFTTHEHDGFQAARTRNDGVRASSAPYLLFLDGDCIAPADHVAQHLRRRRWRAAMVGFCYYLDRATSARVDESAIARGDLDRCIDGRQRRRLTWMDWKARFYSLVKHRQRPKLYSGDLGIWRRDYEAINGFNEEFTGWGCEDDEFGIRLRKSGIQIRSILRWTRTFHLWHPPVPSHPGHWKNGANVEKLARQAALTNPSCLRGLRAPAA
jgi:glycosyltransferase involved in cell wall biosynthesis